MLLKKRARPNHQRPNRKQKATAKKPGAYSQVRKQKRTGPFNLNQNTQPLTQYV